MVAPGRGSEGGPWSGEHVKDRAPPPPPRSSSSTAAAKDRELERLQMQPADAQREHAAAMDAMKGAEFKAKREETLRKQVERRAVMLRRQAGRRAVSSKKAKSKSDTALEKAQAKNARLR